MMLAIVVLFLEIITLGIIRTMGVLKIDDSLASLLIIVFTICFFIVLQNNECFEKYSVQIVLGYFFRIFLLYFDLFGQSIRTLPQSGADSSMFYRTSTELVLYGKTNRHGAFISLMYRVFDFIGINRLYGQFLLMLLSIAAILLFVITVDNLSIDNSVKKSVIWIICMLPNFALLSSIFLRESLVTFLITASVCSFIWWMQNGNFFIYFASIVFSMLACVFHSGSIGITIGCIVGLLIYDYREGKIHTTIGNFLLAFVFATIASFVFIRYGNQLMTHFLDVESVADIANMSTLGGSSYTRFVGNSDTPINMLIYTLPRIVFFLFSPFPWQWRGLSDIIAFVFSSLYYLIVIKNVVSYLMEPENRKKGAVIALLIIAFFCTFIFSWGVSNTGTASRHRDKMVCLFGLLFAMTAKTRDKEVTFTTNSKYS